MSSEMTVTFPGKKLVETRIGKHVIRTDQTVEDGGDDSAPGPFDLFLASIGTCAGVFVAGFCENRGLSTEGIEIRQRNHYDAEGKTLVRVELDVIAPPGFPEKYREALVRVVDKCKVKRSIQAQPAFEVKAVVRG